MTKTPDNQPPYPISVIAGQGKQPTIVLSTDPQALKDKIVIQPASHILPSQEGESRFVVTADPDGLTVIPIEVSFESSKNTHTD